MTIEDALRMEHYTQFCNLPSHRIPGTDSLFTFKKTDCLFIGSEYYICDPAQNLVRYSRAKILFLNCKWNPQKK